MREIRLHGRGGQGVATAGEILSLAAFYEGKYAQSFPYFGAERRGAPVVAYTRFDDKPIQIRTSIYHPSCVIVLDPKLIKTVNVTDGLEEGGVLVLNTAMSPSDVSVSSKLSQIATVDATRIALRTIGVPITNMAMLGAFSAATHWIAKSAIASAINNRLPDDIAGKNVRAMEVAYEETQFLVELNQNEC